jgi:hypothetical protein
MRGGIPACGVELQDVSSHDRVSANQNGWNLGLFDKNENYHIIYI